MAIKAVPVVSGPIYLADVSPAVARLEGDAPDSERAWISVRQATEQDAMKLEDALPDTTVEFIDAVDDVGRPIRREVQKRSDKVRDRFAMQVYLTLCDAGNIWADEDETQPLFKFRKGTNYSRYAGGFQEFLQAFGQLPSVVTIAMRDIVYDHNPMWDWRPLVMPVGSEDDEETGKK